MRLALFGGTFDPVHSGHVEAALATVEQHALDRVLVVPCGRPPHKPESCQASYEHRFRMVQFACEADSRMEAHRLEEPRLDGEPNYSIDTIRRVAAEFRFDPPLRLVVGADAYAEVGQWRAADEVRRAVEFLVVARPDADAGVVGSFPSTGVQLVRFAHSASSRLVRHRAKIGGTLADLAPAAVCRYIWEHGLYRRFDAERLASASPERASHPTMDA